MRVGVQKLGFTSRGGGRASAILSVSRIDHAADQAAAQGDADVVAWVRAMPWSVCLQTRQGRPGWGLKQQVCPCLFLTGEEQHSWALPPAA